MKMLKFEQYETHTRALVDIDGVEHDFIWFYNDDRIYDITDNPMRFGITLVVSGEDIYEEA